MEKESVKATMGAMKERMGAQAKEYETVHHTHYL
jgi:hypothetical protein